MMMTTMTIVIIIFNALRCKEPLLLTLLLLLTLIQPRRDTETPYMHVGRLVPPCHVQTVEALVSELSE